MAGAAMRFADCQDLPLLYPYADVVYQHLPHNRAREIPGFENCVPG